MTGGEIKKMTKSKDRRSYNPSFDQFGDSYPLNRLFSTVSSDLFIYSY
jgi:hypothetical protein